MDFNPLEHLIFEGIVGSKLYGTDTVYSDTDYRGVCIPPLKVLINPFHSFEQKDSGFEEEDRVIYSLSKFFKLCMENNPNILELLFVPKTMMRKCSSIWTEIVSYRHMFLSKKVARTFMGYATAQFHLVERHRKWLLKPLTKPTREEYGLTSTPDITPDTVVGVKYELIKEEYVEQLRKEIAYREAMREWHSYNQWELHRNPERKVLEEKHGFDTKAASHLFRLLQEGTELLATGNLVFPLHGATTLREIRDGVFSYNELLRGLDNYKAAFRYTEEQTRLPDKPNENGILRLYYKLAGV